MGNYIESAVVSKIRDERSIGAILIDTGRLSAIDVEKILREQKQKNLRFGDAAIKLGVLKEEDIQFAMARQFEYPYLMYGDQSISEEVIAAFNPFSAVVEQLRELRSQLMLRWFDTEGSRKTLAIVSPGSGEGRSFIAANLAVVFSQLGEKTLLIDADLRRSRQQKLFKTEASPGLSAILSGRASLENAVVKVESLLGLSVLPAGVMPPNPQELLGRDAFPAMLAELGHSFDIIIIDTPPASTCADAQTIAARAGAAMVVARKHLTPAVTMQKLIANMQNANVSLVGTLLNNI